jgi:hypothetical protein
LVTTTTSPARSWREGGRARVMPGRAGDGVCIKAPCPSLRQSITLPSSDWSAVDTLAYPRIMDRTLPKSIQFWPGVLSRSCPCSC